MWTWVILDIMRLFLLLWVQWVRSESNMRTVDPGVPLTYTGESEQNCWPLNTRCQAMQQVPEGRTVWTLLSSVVFWAWSILWPIVPTVFTSPTSLPFFPVVLGIALRGSPMLGKHPSTELYPESFEMTRTAWTFGMILLCFGIWIIWVKSRSESWRDKGNLQHL